MIFVGGVPFQNNSNNEGSCDLVALMEHPALISASLSLRATPEKVFSASEASSSDGLTKSKHVYLFQREYATVDPMLVDLVGTDEATTCVGIVIRNRNNGMTSAAHMDSPKIVKIGLSQMLSKLADQKLDAELDVHLIGGFDDTPSLLAGKARHKNNTKGGYSFPLCAKIIEGLGKSALKFHIQTLFVLGHNTKNDGEGNAYPIFTGFLMETMTGAVTPAIFDKTTRCPDELVRRIRVSASFEDPCWRGKLLDTYDTETDQFIIAPSSWSVRKVQMATYLQQLPDSEILHTCSTSPYAEAPDFVYNQRRQWDYLIKHSNWKEVFRMGQPRVFKRDTNGQWVMIEQDLLT
ncbi:protein N-terminal asparagine amidohydrolase [Silene latifolia]|uniref:protein N-terminal asparagine amidohydrolase n=1 Tax=Silene latifolia TaxID=37657 RepID=UPI003D77F055